MCKGFIDISLEYMYVCIWQGNHLWRQIHTSPSSALKFCACTAEEEHFGRRAGGANGASQYDFPSLLWTLQTFIIFYKKKKYPFDLLMAMLEKVCSDHAYAVVGTQYTSKQSVHVSTITGSFHCSFQL